MIADLELENFTAFRKLDISFSSKINVIVGSNGTGKTHLLKVIYALAGLGSHQPQTHSNHSDLDAILSEKLLRLFLPTENKIGALHADGAKGQGSISIKNSNGSIIAATFNYNSKKSRLNKKAQPDNKGEGPVFIPTKEVLSLVKGVRHGEHDQATIERIFDDTYLDLVKLLTGRGAENDKQNNLENPRIYNIAKELVKLMGGRYCLKGESGFCFEAGAYEEKASLDLSEPKAAQMYQDPTVTRFVQTKKRNLSSDMTAEGYRKIGVLHRLVENGTFNQKGGGLLLWDEPEANLNPKLMKKLVEAVLELSRNGQQIVLATHDYVLLKWFDLLMDKGKEDHVRYHVLDNNDSAKGVRVSSTDEYSQLSKNAISNTFAELYDAEIERSLGGAPA